MGLLQTKTSVGCCRCTEGQPSIVPAILRPPRQPRLRAAALLDKDSAREAHELKGFLLWLQSFCRLGGWSANSSFRLDFYHPGQASPTKTSYVDTRSTQVTLEGPFSNTAHLDSEICYRCRTPWVSPAVAQWPPESPACDRKGWRPFTGLHTSNGQNSSKGSIEGSFGPLLSSWQPKYTYTFPSVSPRRHILTSAKQ